MTVETGFEMIKMVHNNSLPGIPGGTGSFADASK